MGAEGATVVLACIALAACAAPSARTAEVKPSEPPIRVARIFVEEQDRGYLWPGQLERAGDPATEVEKLGPFIEGCAAIEFAMPGDLESSYFGGVTRALQRAGFENVGVFQRMVSDLKETHLIAQFFARPVTLLSLPEGDPRRLPITGALWEAELPFSWESGSDAWLLKIPATARGATLRELATSRVLVEYSLDDLELPLPEPSELHPSPRPSSHLFHRVAVMSGPGEDAAYRRWTRLRNHPSEPWSIEVLSDARTMLRVDSKRFAAVMVHGKRLREGFAYDAFGGQFEVVLCPPEIVYLGLYAMGSGELRDHGGEWPEMPRMWQSRIPFWWEGGMGWYVNVPAFHFERALELKTAEPTVAYSMKSPPKLEIGAAAPPLRGRFEDGTPAHLSRFTGRPVWVFLNLPLGFDGLEMREVREAWRAAASAGSPPVLLLPRPRDEVDVQALVLLGEAREHVEFLYFDDDDSWGESDTRQLTLLGDEYGVYENLEYGLHPAGLLIDANGRIQARVRSDAIFHSFRRQLRDAVGLP